MEWIKCSERLPEKGISVLLFLKSGVNTKITTGMICVSDNQLLDGEFRIGFSEYDEDVLVRDTVTHWMPLPQPPKED